MGKEGEDPLHNWRAERVIGAGGGRRKDEEHGRKRKDEQEVKDGRGGIKDGWR